MTNEFEPQEGQLRREDWKALALLLGQLKKETIRDINDNRTTKEMKGQAEHIVFFNCGRNSGASQAHRHIQVVEWPESPSSDEVEEHEKKKKKKVSTGAPRTKKPRWFPEELKMEQNSKTPYSHPHIPFTHFILPLPATHPHPNGTPTDYYLNSLYRTYLLLLTAAKLAIAQYNSRYSTQLPVHYNLIMTQTFMMLVPRSTGFCEGPKECPEVWVNSVGLLGMVWVKDWMEAEGWRVVGCDNVLRAVGIPRE